MSNSKTIYVSPAAGVKVHDPVAKDFLPEEGREVVPSVYWSRRLDDGDVTVKAPAKTSVKTSK